MKNYYFPHDYKARHDSKLLLLRQMGGLEAIGAYWQTIEILHETENKINLDPDNGRADKLFAIQLGVDQVKATELINLMIEVGLLIKEQFIVSSNRVAENFAVRKSISEKASMAAKIRYTNQAVNATASERMRPNAIKENKIKENKIKIIENNDPPTLLESKVIKEPKLNFGEDGKVLLTATEHQKLNLQLGADKLNQCIEVLNNFIGSKKRDPYASHYHAIKKWVVEAVEQKQNIKKPPIKPTAVIMNTMATDWSAQEFLNKRGDNETK